MLNRTKLEAFEAALAHYGTQEKMADAIGVHQTSIGRALQSSKEVRAEWVLQIEKDTGISRHELRPDIYPIEPPKSLDGENIAGEWLDDYGKQHPILDRQLQAAQ